MYVLVDLLVEIILADPCSLADRSDRLLVFGNLLLLSFVRLFCTFNLYQYIRS